MKRRVVLLLTVFVVFFSFTGCSNTQTKQSKAVQTALNEASETSEKFFFYRCDDLKDQVQQQLKEKGDKDSTEYTIKISVPNLANLNVDNIQVEAPDYNLSETKFTDFTAEYKKRAKDAMKSSVVLSDDVTWSERKIRVELKKDGSKWKASVNTVDLTAITSVLDLSADRKAETVIKESEAYKKMSVAALMNSRLTPAFPDLAFRTAVKVQEVNISEDGSYDVTIRYPDPNEVYSKAVEKSYEAYKQKGKVIYGTQTVQNVAASMQTHITTAASEVQNTMDSTFKVNADSTNGDGFEELKKTMTEARTAKIEDLQKRVNNEFVFKETSKPKTKRLSGSKSGLSITIKSSKALGDMHLTFYKLSGTDMNQKGTKKLSVFIRKGESLTVYLPAGNYKMIQGKGDKWFGEKISFGPNGTYEQSNTLMKIKSGYYYTLTLYGVSGGNLPKKSIPYPYS